MTLVALAPPEMARDGVARNEVARNEVVRDELVHDDGTLAEVTLADVLARQALIRPSATCVEQGERWLSYAELAQRVSLLAQRLVELGVGPELPVVVCLPRCPELVVAALAVWRAGGVYVPLDPAGPPGRLSTVLSAAGRAVVVVTRSELAAFLPLAGRPPVLVDADQPARPAPPPGRRPVEVSPRQLAYVVHTSGSTGIPKGVMVEQGVFLAHARAMVAQYGITEADRVLLLCPPYVDVALEQLAVTLLAGASLVLAGEQPWSPAELPDRVAQHAVTVLDVAPVVWRDLLDRVGPEETRLATLSLVNVGTDVVYASDAQRWFAQGVGGRFVASYGPTEAVITSTLCPVPADEAYRLAPLAPLPIGVEVAQTVGHVLDADLRPAAASVPGELYLGGAGLARGYYGQPALTAERFVPDPFAGEPGARMYRSGDLASRRADGALDFHGRRDRQVKINSHRVELGEIEACLLGVAELRAACVVAVPSGGTTRLAAYVVPAGPVPPTIPQLRRHLRERLPDYMVPAQWTVLESLPMTPNGKVDVPALPATAPAVATMDDATVDGAPVSSAPVDSAPVNSATVNVIVELWRSVLGREQTGVDSIGVDPIGVNDDFFDLGGNSLLATRVHARLQNRFGISVPLRVMFEATTVAQLAAVVTEAVTQEVAGLSDAAVAEQLLDAVDELAQRDTRVRRQADFDVTLQIKRPDFVAAPRGGHRDWLIERTLDELSDTLRHLDETSRTFVAGAERPSMAARWQTAPARYTGSRLVIDGQEVMQDWERPLMAALARLVAEGGGDVLEVGFGMGISASYIQQLGVRSHTIIEASQAVAEEFHRWRGQFPDRRIELVLGRWQEVIGGLGQFDAILFDTYPTTEAEFRQEVVLSTTFAESFFAAASAHLRPGGVFSYYSNEIDSLGRRHQRRLLEHFRSFSVEVVTGLQPPADCPYWWANSMVAVKAVK